MSVLSFPDSVWIPFSRILFSVRVCLSSHSFFFDRYRSRLVELARFRTTLRSSSRSFYPCVVNAHLDNGEFVTLNGSSRFVFWRMWQSHEESTRNRAHGSCRHASFRLPLPFDRYHSNRRASTPAATRRPPRAVPPPIASAFDPTSPRDSAAPSLHVVPQRRSDDASVPDSRAGRS